MKKVFLFIMLLSANVLAWGQTAKGKEALEKAKAGDIEAQSFVGECYEFGEEGFPKDLKLAFEWFLKAADAGEGMAIMRMQFAYKDGRFDTPKNDEKYIHYLKKGADMEIEINMTDLAVCYRDGTHGVKKDEKEFLRLALKASDKHSKPKYELGVYYKRKNNKEEAIKWYKDCADYYYKISGAKHEDALRDLKQLGVDYDPTKKNAEEEEEEEDDGIAVKDGKVILYARTGEVLQSAMLMEKNGATHVKVDNALYKLKPCNLRVNGVTYNYSVFLLDRDYYVKGRIPGFKSGSASSKSNGTAKRSTATTTKRSSATTTKSNSQATTKKSNSSADSDDSSLTDDIGKAVGKEVKKELNKKVDKGLKKLKKVF